MTTTKKRKGKENKYSLESKRVSKPRYIVYRVSQATNEFSFFCKLIKPAQKRPWHLPKENAQFMVAAWKKDHTSVHVKKFDTFKDAEIKLNEIIVWGNRNLFTYGIDILPEDRYTIQENI